MSHDMRGDYRNEVNEALCKKLVKQPYICQFEMSDFLYATFGKGVSERSIARTLRSIGWTMKVIRRIAQQRNADLRDYYLHRSRNTGPINLSLLMSLASTEGWTPSLGMVPKGSSPIHVTRLNRAKRWHILPAYAQGVVRGRATPLHGADEVRYRQTPSRGHSVYRTTHVEPRLLIYVCQSILSMWE